MATVCRVTSTWTSTPSTAASEQHMTTMKHADFHVSVAVQAGSFGLDGGFGPVMRLRPRRRSHGRTGAGPGPRLAGPCGPEGTRTICSRVGSMVSCFSSQDQAVISS